MTAPRLDGREMLALGAMGVFLFVDGFDLVALSLAASGVSASLDLTPKVLGFALGAAQFGSILGALGIGRLSERVDRRMLILATALVMAAGSLISGLAWSIGPLVAGRLVTGIGLGAASPLAVGYLTGHVRSDRRATAIGIVLASYNAGQIAGGLAAPAILPRFGWRALFFIGVAVLAVVLPLLGTLRRTGAQAAAGPGETMGIAALVREGWLIPLAVLLAVALIASQITYFLLSWLPFMVQRAGLSLTVASGCASALATGGLLGSLVWGHLIDRLKAPFYVLAAGFVVGSGLLWALAALRQPGPPVLLTVCALLGFFHLGAYTAISCLSGFVFPRRSHVHVVGLSTSLARLGGFLAPVMAGFLLARGPILYGVGAALGLVVAALLVAGGLHDRRSARGAVRRAVAVGGR